MSSFGAFLHQEQPMAELLDWAACRATLYPPLRITPWTVDGESDPERRSVEDYLASLDDEQLVAACHVPIDVMERISGEPPRLWNVGTLGFGRCRYHYDSGRKGESHTLGVYPRRGRNTVYLMDGTAPYPELLGHLGRHSTSRVCLHVKRLSDIDVSVLEEILQQSYDYITSQDAKMRRA
jgi:hypothetical protein